ncbi:hypothetical protein WKT22_05341 [Candidatus Lokiarchaeum ossiferum]
MTYHSCKYHPYEDAENYCTLCGSYCCMDCLRVLKRRHVKLYFCHSCFYERTRLNMLYFWIFSILWVIIGTIFAIGAFKRAGFRFYFFSSIIMWFIPLFLPLLYIYRIFLPARNKKRELDKLEFKLNTH